MLWLRNIRKLLKKANRQKRLLVQWNSIRSEGVFLGSRIHQSYRVYLYHWNNAKYEVWFSVGTGVLYWIEKIKDESRLSEYVTPDILKKIL